MTSYRFPPGPPQAMGLNKLRMGMRFNRDMIRSVMDSFDAYGDVVHIHVDNFHQYIIRHPDHLHQVLVTDAGKYHKGNDYKDERHGLAYFLGNGLLTSDGDFWRRQRRLMQPVFHARRVEAYADTMVSYAGRMLSSWRDGARIDVSDAMMRLTLDIVAKTLFDTEVSADAERIGNAIDVLQSMWNSMQLLPDWVPTPMQIRKRRALRDLNEIIYGIIAERRRTTDDRGDLLSMLLAARDEGGEGMTDRQVRDESVTIILAGHETTANALNWTWFLLAQHPEVEAKLHEELDRALGDEPPTLENLQELTYTEMVIKESMRLYPPAYAVGRVAVEDTTIGDYDVPKGTVLALFTYATHRDPRWWDAPTEFRPERFAGDYEKSLPRYAYLPFSGGPRVCIGNSFAMMEARLLLATIAQRYRLKLAPGQSVKLDPKITLRPKGGLRMTLEARQPGPRREAAAPAREAPLPV